MFKGDEVWKSDSLCKASPLEVELDTNAGGQACFVCEGDNVVTGSSGLACKAVNRVIVN